MLKGDDKEAIEAKTTALTEAISGVAEKMYADAAQQAQAGEAGQADDAQQEGKKADDAVDAEFEEVKDDNKK